MVFQVQIYIDVVDVGIVWHTILFELGKSFWDRKLRGVGQSFWHEGSMQNFSHEYYVDLKQESIVC